MLTFKVQTNLSEALAAAIGKADVHMVFVIRENTQNREFRENRFDFRPGCGFRVLRAEPGKNKQARVNGGDGFTADTDTGLFNPLHDKAHGYSSPFPAWGWAAS